MAKESAPAATRPAPPRDLWQVPAFLLGVAAVVGVVLARPLWQDTPADRYRRELAALRLAADKFPGDVDVPQVQGLIRRVLDDADQFPQFAAQTHLQVGSAYVAVGEKQVYAAPPERPSDEEAADAWKFARQHLEQADPAGLDAQDRMRLAFRLAKTLARDPKADPQKVIDALLHSITGGDDPSEGFRLLAGLYLRLPTPDTKKARDALREHLSRALQRTPAAVLARSRLQLADLHAKLGELEEARKVLERVGTDPPDLYVAARSQLAKSYLAEEDWGQAIRCWEQAREVKGIAPEQRGAILYYLADCYLKVNRRDEAVAALKEAQQGSGPESEASALRLAALMLRDRDPERDTAIRALETALEKVAGPAEYNNPLLPIPEARAIYEEAIQVYRLGGEWEQALRAARAYARIAEPGRDRELAAETFEAQAQALRQQAEQAAGPDKARLLDDANRNLRLAASEFQALAAKRPPADRVELQRRAAAYFLKAGDRQRAREMLEEVAQAPGLPPDKLGEVWFLVGEAYREEGNKEQARAAYKKALETPGPVLARCRLQLAMLLMEGTNANDLAEAVGYLEQNTEPEFEKERDTFEQSLFQLGYTRFQRRDYGRAAEALVRALERFPESPQALRARYYEGRCYWFLAAREAGKIREGQAKFAASGTAEEVRKQTQQAIAAAEKQYRKYLEQAVEPFNAVEAVLVRSQTAGTLTPADAVLLRQASFSAAECYFFLGNYDESTVRYDRLVLRYKGKVEELVALSQLWHCYSVRLAQPEEARKALQKMRNAFTDMPDAVFDNSTEIHRRKYWEDWFKQVEAIEQPANPMGKN